jgi:hypothetical protein
MSLRSLYQPQYYIILLYLVDTEPQGSWKMCAFVEHKNNYEVFHECKFNLTSIYFQILTLFFVIILANNVFSSS